MEKRCNHCGLIKAIEDFYGDSAARDGHRPECKVCTAARRKRWYEANRERASHLRRTFNLTAEQYEIMLAAQGGVCAVCGREPKPGKALHIDHNHETGAVRGLVCFSCNSALGNLQEDEVRISALLTYLITHDPEQIELAAITQRRLAALSA